MTQVAKIFSISSFINMSQVHLLPGGQFCRFGIAHQGAPKSILGTRAPKAANATNEEPKDDNDTNGEPEESV
jgi:hypothetical protein